MLWSCNIKSCQQKKEISTIEDSFQWIKIEGIAGNGDRNKNQAYFCPEHGLKIIDAINKIESQYDYILSEITKDEITGYFKYEKTGEYIQDILMEKHLGRRLKPKREEVKHIDGDVGNNCIENLTLILKGEKY